jgi:hypothetical protein
MKRYWIKFRNNFRQINWRIPIFIISTSMSIVLIISFFILGGFSSTYGTDYIAYWSAGKIADQLGYSEIYDLNILRSVQTSELEFLGVLSISESSSFRILPANYFSFFILPFQVLSRIDLIDGYWLWTILNLSVLIGYLLFFMKKTLSESGDIKRSLKLLFLILISYSVLSNFFNGQVSVFMLVCTGEFIRNSIKERAILSGLWLGGLMIKPQSLILVIAVILFMRNWKILLGLIISSCMILIISFMLSGFSGNEALINLWMGSSMGDETSNAEAFINWRMIGLNLNHIFNTTHGWIITGAGMVLTIPALYFLINQDPPLGSPSWVIMMLGVFSANLAFTWHTHQHMAMILIPFLIYASINSLISDKVLFLWATITQVLWFGMMTISATDNNLIMAVAISGFALNILIFISTLKTVNKMAL